MYVRRAAALVVGVVPHQVLGKLHDHVVIGPGEKQRVGTAAQSRPPGRQPAVDLSPTATGVGRARRAGKGAVGRTLHLVGIGQQSSRFPVSSVSSIHQPGRSL